MKYISPGRKVNSSISHDCSDCFRLEPIAGWALHPLESAALSRRTPEAVINAEPGGAPNHRGCIYIRYVLFCQTPTCVSDNNHCIDERREMSTQSLPVASLRTGNC